MHFAAVTTGGDFCALAMTTTATTQGAESPRGPAGPGQHVAKGPAPVHPHLAACLAVIVLLCGAFILARTYADGVASNYVHALAPTMFEQKNQGSALQAEAFRQPDLLPVYGSSELIYSDPYHANVLFRRYPTGFTIFPVGTADTEPLNMVQKLAAVGSDLAGKKVVISLSPSFFYEGQYHPETYAGNYSPLHANALAFSTDLSLGVRRDVARRMLDYPDTLENDPVLTFALARLADGSAASLALYYAALPLGKLHLLILTLQDQWATLDYIGHNQSLKTNIPRKAEKLDWEALAAQAERDYRKHATNNPFGMDNEQWLYYGSEVLKGKDSTTDAKFLQLVSKSEGWSDLELLLRGLADLGATPLVICLPINGGYFDFQGISYSARAILYQQLRDEVKAHGYAVVVMDGYDEDKYFLMDPGAHLSSKGWVIYDQTLDAFYHGTLQ